MTGDRSTSRERLYTPYVVTAGGATIACVFRDHALSDLIGFNYAGWPSDAAADDFVARLAEAGRRYTASHRAGGHDPHHSRRRERVGALRRRVAGPSCAPCTRACPSTVSCSTVTVGDACAAGGPPLSSIFPGSWIDANFYIWIGHADDRKAWSQLAEAREALEGAPGEPAALATGPRGDADRRGERLVLVVWRRPFVGSRPGVRRAVPPPSAERLPPDRPPGA